MVGFQTLRPPLLDFALDGFDLLLRSHSISDERRHVAHQRAVGPSVAQRLVLRIDDEIVVESFLLEELRGAVVRVHDYRVEGAHQRGVLCKR